MAPKISAKMIWFPPNFISRLLFPLPTDKWKNEKKNRESSQFSFFLLSLNLSLSPSHFNSLLPPLPPSQPALRRSVSDHNPSLSKTFSLLQLQRDVRRWCLFQIKASVLFPYLFGLVKWVFGKCKRHRERKWWSGASSSFPAHNFRPANPIGAVNDPATVPVPTEMVSCVYYFEICWVLDDDRILEKGLVGCLLTMTSTWKLETFAIVLVFFFVCVLWMIDAYIV